MSRLRDEQSNDPVIAEAALLLRAVAPTESTGSAKARVWSGLRERTRPSPRLLGLRPALAAVLVLVLGAMASATALRGWRWHQARVEAEAASALVVIPTVPAARNRRRARPAMPAILAAPPETVALVVPAPLVTAPAPIVEAAPAMLLAAPVAAPSSHATPITAPPVSIAHHAPHAHTVARPHAVAAAHTSIAAHPLEVAAPAAEPPAGLLQQAMRALRYEHDASRAAALADAYLAEHADGDLVEEAMAIAIEAHAQLGDAHAHALAARYLARFPEGRFRAAAQLAL